MVNLHGARVLIVEDEPAARDAVAALFALEGADVSAVATGQEALDLFRSERFDVVVSDLGLPDIPGDVLIRTLVAAATAPGRIISITGEGEPGATRARDAGAEIVFVKPLDWTRIVEQLAPGTVARAA